MESELRYRLMFESDVTAVAALEKESFSSPWSRATFEEIVRDPTSFVLVAETRNRLAGYVVGFCTGAEFLIANLAVRRECRRQGIGAELLQQACREAGKRGSRLILLDVRPSNHPAIRLYRRFGFRPLARKKNYYSNPREDSVVMGRFLTH